MTGVFIQGRPGFHQCIHIGHGYQDLYTILCHWSGNGELIQVTRVVVVNGTPEQVAQVADRGCGLLGGSLDAVELGKGFRGKIREQTSLKHDPVGDVL